MPTFTANLSMLFKEQAFESRFEQSALAGFTHVECLFPYEMDREALKKTLNQHQLQFSLFNAPAGDWDKGERGFAAFVNGQQQFRESIQLAYDYAAVIGCKKVHVMSGGLSKDSTQTFCRDIFIDNIRYAADLFADAGIDVLLEPLNTRDNPHYFLTDFYQAIELIECIDRENVKLQFDFYHAQIIHGDVSTLFTKLFPYIGHIQIASVPERQEPISGELNYSYLFNLIDQLEYSGEVGCEYNPAGTTCEGLSWLTNYYKLM